MEPHQERIVAEKSELDNKIQNLTNFLTNDETRAKIGDAEQDRMQRQLDCMSAYSGILGERIDAFGGETEPAPEEPRTDLGPQAPVLAGTTPAATTEEEEEDEEQDDEAAE